MCAAYVVNTFDIFTVFIQIAQFFFPSINAQIGTYLTFIHRINLNEIDWFINAWIYYTANVSMMILTLLDRF